MNIVFVSTFDAPCGIATYTRKLGDALAELGVGVFVYAEHQGTSGFTAGAAVHDLGKVKYMRQWLRGAPYESPMGLGAVAASIKAGRVKPDVVHIQHEFGLFPRTPDVVRFAKDLGGLPVVITLHTVDEAHIIGLRTLAEDVGHAVVHSHEALALLWGHAAHVVPHGATAPLRPRDKPSCVLVPGFVSANKGTLEILEGYWRCLREHPSFPYPLRIAGLCRDALYEAKVRSAIARYELGERVTFDNAFLTDEQALDALNRAAAVVLGGGDTSPYSASGQLHDAVGLGVPAIAKRVPIYMTPGNAGVLFYDDAESCATRLAAVQDEKLMFYLEGRQQRAAMELSWTKIAMWTRTFYGR
jgi:glycosyltransferase involved in cell wall biosynthesis